MRNYFQHIRNKYFQLKKWLIFFGVDFLKSLVDTRFEFLTSIILRVLSLFPIHTQRMDALYAHVYTLNESGPSARSAQALIHLKRWQASFDTPKTDIDLATLSENQNIHIFLEPGAALPEFLAKLPPKESHFKIYSFSDQSARVQKLDINSQATLISLRDKFNDISKEGEDLFQFCRVISDHLIAKMTSGKLAVFDIESSNQFESSAIFLEDAISHKMSMAMCLKQAMDEVPSDDAIVYVAQSSSYLIDGWAFFRTLSSRDKFFVAYISPNEIFQPKFWRSLAYRVKEQKLLQRHRFAPLSKAINSIQKNLAAQHRSIRKFVRNECRILSQTMPTETEVFFLTMGKPGIYTQARNQLSENLALQNDRYNHASSVYLNLSTTATAVKQDKSSGSIIYNLSNYTDLITKFRSSEVYLDTYIREVNSDLPSVEGFKGAELWSFIEPSIKTFLQVQISWWMINYNFGKTLSKRRPGSKYLGLSTRQPAIRSFCAGVKDQNSAPGAIFDVQCLNVLRHPKYRKILADYSIVIDKQAAEIYENYFGVDKQSIYVGGAPQYDEFLSDYNAVEKEKILKKFELNDTAFYLLFISQLQPLSIMFDMLGPACLSAQENDSIHIIIRLHPREGEARKRAYSKYLKGFLQPHQFSFSQTESVAEILKITSMCITWYSNMAREATLVGKTVFVPEYLPQEAPLALSLYNLGLAISSKTELTEKILDAVSSTDANNEAPNQYLLDNRSIAEGKCSENILDFIFEQKAQKTNPKSKVSKNKSFVLDALKDKDDLNLVVLSPSLSATSLQHYCMGKNIKLFGYTDIKPQIQTAQNVEIAKLSVTRGSENSLDISAHWANEIADSSLNFLDKLVAPSSPLGDFVNRTRKALWMSMRSELMTATRIEQNILGSTENDKPIIIFGGSKDQIYWTLKQIQKKRSDFLNCYVVSETDQSETGIVLGKNYADGYKLDDTHGKVNQDTPLSHINHVKSEFETWFTVLCKTLIEKQTPADILITMDWYLKTVPPTLLPILKDIAKHDKNILLVNRRVKGMEAASRALQNLGDMSDNITLMDAEALLTLHTPPSLKSRRNLFSLWNNWLGSQSFFNAQSPLLQQALRKTIKNVINIHFIRIAIWDRYCTDFMANGCRVSIACPGRQWHSWVAHRAAELHGRSSMTIQNAYMSKGYTYFPPTADYITCIDGWSKSLLENHYNIDPERLHITSTPRFDDMFISCETSSPKKKQRSRSPKERTVLFATQPDFEAETLKVINSIASKFNTSNDIPCRLIIKLHPRTTASELALIQNSVKSLGEDHNITIETTAGISSLLHDSDIIITMFSNVGIEAAIARKPLIIAKAEMENLPLPLDEFDIGFVAESYDDISMAIDKFLTDKAFQTLYQTKVDAFAKKNPIMVSGQSTAVISKVIFQRLGDKLNEHNSINHLDS